MWNAVLFDTMTGQLDQQIDVPSFSWSMTVNNSSFTTTPEREVGDDQVDSLQLPWSQVPGRGPGDRMAALAPYRRGIALFWKTPAMDVNSLGVPVLAGALGVRTSTRESVSFPYVSVMGMLSDRFLVHEKGFGTGANHTSTGQWNFQNMSYRGLACEVIRACTSYKPGGSLPIDLPYLGEGGSHELPVDGADTSDTSTGKTRSSVRRNTPDGYVQTVVDGDRRTVTESHTKTTTVDRQETHQYSYWTKERGEVTETRTTTRKIVTGRVTTVTTTTVVNKKDCATKTVQTSTTVYSFDENGEQTGSKTTTSTPVVTTVPRETESVYKDFNVSAHSCRQILESIASSQGGPDMQFRPYLTEDGQHIRFRFLAGSDGDVYLNQDHVLSLDSSPYGGSLENVQVDWAAPFMRVYGTGAGQDKGMLCDLAEDLSLVQRSVDPWPLREMTYSDSDALDWHVLSSLTHGRLKANSRPVAQFTGVLHADDTDQQGNLLHPLGSFWPGEMFDVSVEGFPDWPDGQYRMRLMEMSGDQSDKVTLKFDPVQIPTAGVSPRTVGVDSLSAPGASVGDQPPHVVGVSGLTITGFDDVLEAPNKGGN